MSSRIASDSIARLLYVGGFVLVLQWTTANSFEGSLGKSSYVHYVPQQKSLIFTRSQELFLETKNLTSLTLSRDSTFGSTIWSTATVYYKIDTKLEAYRSNIETALKLWEQTTCLLFNEIPLNKGFSKPHILFRVPDKRSLMCKTYFGVVKDLEQPQPIYLANKCTNAPEITRLVGYAVGILHKPENTLINSERSLIRQLHRFESKEIWKTGYMQSYFDLKNAHLLYKCNYKRCDQISCNDEGNLTPTCSCNCPSGSTGSNCQSHPTKTERKCGGTIEENTLIESPMFPDSYIHGTLCVWLITPPEGKGVELVVNDFNIKETPGCLGDHLSIYTTQDSEEQRYCGSSVVSNDVITHEPNRNVIVKFITGSYGTGRGFSFNVYFSEDYVETGTISSVDEEFL
ncbi:Uncharacterised protein g4808 [Pycnogonum litorale]